MAVPLLVSGACKGRAEPPDMVRVPPEAMVTEPWLPPAARVPPDQLRVPCHVQEVIGGEGAAGEVKVPPMVRLPSAVKLPPETVRLSLLYELLEAVRLPPVMSRVPPTVSWWMVVVPEE